MPSASKKKGLSMDEKRTRLLQLFYESKEFFQMKELEKIAPKQKGIVAQSVREITQLLVDEGLVECEKIGTFVCYWAFPSKAALTRKRRLEQLNSHLADVQTKIDAMKGDIEKAKIGREDTKERAELLSRFADLKTKEITLKKSLDELALCGPEAIARLNKSADEAKEAVNRWTDNIFSIKKWCKTKFGMDEKTLNEQFDIPSDMDYVE
uniref:Meiotic nuclear division protein 1 homolog n=3 Tax=Parascaris univalens TaxID=6257 RepID=A0A915BG92_PARUN